MLSVQWLKEYVALPEQLTPAELQGELTMVTVEVEQVTHLAEQLRHVIVGQVLEVSPHPNAKRLRLARCDLGGGRSEQIVCGGSNLAPGMWVAVAQPGARVHARNGGGLVEIQPTEVRGVTSRGMLCSAGELDLTNLFPPAEDHEILDLAELGAAAGQMIANVLELEAGIPTEQAVMAEPVACCVNGQTFLQIGEEDTVFIFGTGFIGCVHAELALKKGAKRVVISDMSSERLNTAARLLPEAITFDSSSTDPAGFIRELTGGYGADVIITACPSGEAHRTAMRMASPRARISLFGGIPGEGSGFLDSNAIHYGELSIFGSHASTVAQNRIVVDWITKGELDLGKYISATYPLEKIEEAFEALDNARVLKVQIVPG